MEKQRGDRRASKRRAQMTLYQTRLQMDGTTSTIVYTTRPLNKRLAFTSVSDGLRAAQPDLYRSLLAAMNLQATGLEKRRGAPAATVQPQASPTVAEPVPPDAPPTTQQPGISRRQLSSQAAADDVVSRWKTFRLGATAKRGELIRFLLDNKEPFNCNTRDALLARVEDLLKRLHPEGEAMLHNRVTGAFASL